MGVLVMQRDGNLVEYIRFGSKYSPVWSSRTAGTNVRHAKYSSRTSSLIVQPDGNVVIYRKVRGRKIAVWDAQGNTRHGTRGTYNWSAEKSGGPYSLQVQTTVTSFFTEHQEMQCGGLVNTAACDTQITTKKKLLTLKILNSTLKMMNHSTTNSKHCRLMLLSRVLSFKN